MPLYEYECKSCGHRFEKIQSFSAPEEKICPVCGGPVEKLLSAPAVQFKGSGWYVTDYAGKSGGSSMKASAEKTDNGKSGGESATSSSGESGTAAPASGTSTTKSE